MLAVELLKPKRHDRDGFACGEPSLDDYLRTLATQHHRAGISTTHVLVDDSDSRRILGYYTLAAAQLLLSDLSEEDRRGLPRYPVPAIRMGRLAIAVSAQGQGLGDYLLAHAVARCLGLREQLHALLLAPLGVPREVAVAVSLLFFGHLLVSSLLGAVFWMQSRPLAASPTANLGT